MQVVRQGVSGRGRCRGGQVPCSVLGGKFPFTQYGLFVRISDGQRVSMARCGWLFAAKVSVQSFKPRSTRGIAAVGASPPARR